MTIRRGRSGSVALMTGLLAPAMVMMMSMGIEVTYWSVNQVELQRIADVAAWSGARNYMTSKNAQTASGVAAAVAEVNGVAGVSSPATPTWNAATQQLTDNMISVAIVSGVKSAADTALQVTVRRSIATTFANIFSGAPAAITVSATSTAELVQGSSSGPQPCLTALGTPTSQIDIELDGSATIKTTSCAVRANGSINITGSSSINAGGTYAGGSITYPGWNSSPVTGGTYANDGTIADPYALYAPLQNAFKQLSSGGTAINLGSGASQTISPGTYSGISVSGGATLTMNAGLYIVNGNFQLGGGGTIKGTGVTIVASGYLSLQGGGNMAVTPPLSGAASGIPGIIFASQSTAASQISNGATPPTGGLIYYPNGSMTLAGSVPGSSGCNEYIASKFSITGASNFSSGCGSYGLLTYGSLPGSTAVALVQ